MLILLSLVFSINLKGQKAISILSRLGHSIEVLDVENNYSKSSLDIPVNYLVNPYAMESVQSSDKLYWIDLSNSILYSLSKNATNVNEIQLPQDNIILDICIDQKNNKLYWITKGVQGIFKKPIEGNNVKLVTMDSLTHPTSLAYSSKKRFLFWADYKAKKIFKYSIPHKTTESIFSLENITPVKLYVDDDHELIYFSDDVNGKIHSINFLGDNHEVVYEGSEDESPFSILIDHEDNLLYWTDYSQGVVRVKNFNTDLVEIVATDIVEPIDISFYQIGTKLKNRNAKNDAHLIVYPNPSDGKIFIKVKSESCQNKKVYIHNTLGQLIDILECINDGCEIHLPAGIYTASMYCKEEILRTKFTIK